MIEERGGGEGPRERERARWTLVIHGGAGMRRREPTAAELQAIRATLRLALDTGARVLGAGGRGLDAVQDAVRVMEASGVLNAGRGAVLNRDGFAELDAALMDGRGRRAGAVAAVRHLAHPIDIARAVMEEGRHVMLAGEGAKQFALEQGLSLVPDEYFTSARWHPAGTVGAVALDAHGDLAAATSTGGLAGKRAGRVGDSPIIGAGTFAENGVCAVSCTGAGESFVRFTAAGEVAARVKLLGRDIDVAAGEVIDSLKAHGGLGGIIAVDAHGRIATPFSSQTMLRGWARSGTEPEVIVDQATAT